MRMFAVTGTKGKTTTTYLVKSVLERMGLKAGLRGYRRLKTCLRRYTRLGRNRRLIRTWLRRGNLRLGGLPIRGLVVIWLLIHPLHL